MPSIYLADSDYDATLARLVAVLNTSKRTTHHPFRPTASTLQYNLAAALWCSRIDGGRVLDPLWTEHRQGHSLIVALASLEPDPVTGNYTRDQIIWTLADAGVFPDRARVLAA